MARTRATKGSSKAEATSTTSTSVARYTLSEESKTPPKLFILPKKATTDAQIVTLQDPRYGKPTRYLACPESGIYEFKRITAPQSTPRSWLIQGSSGELKSQDQESAENEGFEAQVSKGADLYVATLIDPLFLVLPALAAKGQGRKSSDSPKRMFMSSDDHFDSISDSGHLFELLRLGETRALLESRMAVICDTVDAGDEKMFRLNETKLLEELVSKAKRMSENGLPKSMEEKFVTKALEAPILGIRSQPTAVSTSQDETSGTPEGTKSPQLDEQSSFSSTDSIQTAASDSAASTAATSVIDGPTSAAADVVVSAISASPDVIKLQRLRIAIHFILSSYITPDIAQQLKKDVESKKEVVDFTPLNEYLEKLAKLREEAAALRTSDYSRKRNRDEEDDERAEKKRKKDEEEKRKKAAESRGVRDLKKVNTSGMKKLSEFFKKK